MTSKQLDDYLDALFAVADDEPDDAGLWRTLARKVPA